MSQYALARGDVAAVLAGFRENSFDALMCDPPYGFRFMGKAWDYDVPSVETWAECLRVLKPGAPLVAFGGSRTYHRLACGVEDAGFELRDCLMWLYGKGFPKSLNIGLSIDKAAGAVRDVVGQRKVTGTARIKGGQGNATAGRAGEFYETHEVRDFIPVTEPATALAKAWDGYGTALKPAHEPIVLARKPLDGTVAANVARWGVGGLAIDACRIEGEGNVKWTKPRAGICNTDPTVNPEAVLVDAGGRWPANLILDEDAATLLDAEAGDRPSVPFRANSAEGAVLPMRTRTAGGYADGGGPSRFFYCSKVSTKEREAGCEGLVLRSAGEVTERADADEVGGRPAGLDNPRAGAGRTGGARNHHPTLKPLSLTKWLAKLLLPPRPDAVILVPFAGAGSEMIGALQAGWGGVFGIEREAEYIEIAKARLRHWVPEGREAA